MQETEFRVLRECDLSRAEKQIEDACSALGLHVAMKTSLAKHPGSVHWHYKNGKQSGTLELTLLASHRRIWAQEQNRRKAEWIDATLPKVQRSIERAIKA